jgi:phage terminase small subunit
MANGESLTPKQQDFADKYIKTGNASEAYRQAYNTENCNKVTVGREATALLNHHLITTEIQRQQAESARANAVTVQSLTTELEQARLCAVKQDNAAGQVSASATKAKLHGFFVDKHQDVSQSRIDSLSDEEVETLLARYLEGQGKTLDTG